MKQVETRDKKTFINNNQKQPTRMETKQPYQKPTTEAIDLELQSLIAASLNGGSMQDPDIDQGGSGGGGLDWDNIWGS